MLFKRVCSVCAEKDSRIEDLKEQIRHLRAQFSTNSIDPLPMQLEAQKILEGSLSNVVDIDAPSNSKLKELAVRKMEEHKMLSGDEIVI
jgi:hypothetical protein